MADIRTIDYKGFNFATGSNGTPGFIIYSGSVSLGSDVSSITNYTGVGIEAIGNSESFLRFRTVPNELEIRTNRFFLGSNDAFISGSGDGTIAMSSSNFLLNEAGDVTMQGVITAEAGGTIGGWNIESDAIVDVNNNMRIDSDGPYHISASGFQVDTAGAITASAGSIAGWNLDGDSLTSNNATAFNIVLGNSSGMLLEGGLTPLIHLNPGNGNVNEFVKMYYNNSGDFGIQANANSSTATFQLGSTNQIAGWSFNTEQITGGNMIINKSGTIQTSDYISNLQGFTLSAASGGFLEVENAKIRGTLATAVFEKETVNAVGGQLYVANSTTLTGSVIAGQNNQGGEYAPTDTTMSVVNVSGFATGEILSLKRVHDTGFTTEYIKIESSSRLDSSSDTDFTGLIFVERGLGTSGGVDSGSIGDVGAAAQSYSGSQVIVSTGKVGTGYIRLNANPNDPTTPYMDIVERTGSSVYAVDLKARLGDLSGVTDTINGQAVSGFGLYTDNAFLKGGIVATYGSIGGFGINATTISSSNNNLILRDNGDITGSQVKFTGGDIGGFNIDAHSLSTTGVEVNDSTQDLFISSSNFQVSHDGTFTASGALIQGNSTFNGIVNVANGSEIPGLGIYQHGPLTHHPRSAGTPSNDILPNATFNDTEDNAIEYVTGPFGGQELAITAYPDSNSDADGGFNSDLFPIDSGSAYMFVVYMKRNTHAASGSAYFGTEGFDSADGADDEFILNNDSGLTVEDNPYFFSGDVTPAGETVNDSLNRWFLHVGYVYPSGSAYDATRKSVCYDLTTGLTASYSSANEKTFIWRGGCTHGRIRVYHYYNSSGDSNTKFAEFARPAVYKMDGSEPTIQSLLSNVSEGGNTVIDGASITTGKIQSANFGTSAGSEINLNDGTIKMGGSSNPGFSVDSSGFVQATNFAEKIVTVTAANSSSYFKNDSTTGVKLVFDGSEGGEITMNMQLNVRPYNTSANAHRKITDVILPQQASGQLAEVKVIINADNVNFDDGEIASNYANMTK